VCANPHLLCCTCLQRVMLSGCNMIPMCIAKTKKWGSSLLYVLICNYFVALVCNVGCPLVATLFPCALQKQRGGSSLLCANLQLLCCACLQRVMLSGCNIIPMCIAKTKNAKKTYGWLFSPHRMQTCLMCLSQGRGRSLIQ
jgi:hypothetical protein